MTPPEVRPVFAQVGRNDELHWWQRRWWWSVTVIDPESPEAETARIFDVPAAMVLTNVESRYGRTRAKRWAASSAKYYSDQLVRRNP